MTHEVIRHLLDDYVTGELTEDARGPVADHIATCEICRTEVEGLKGILARAAELPKSIDPPAGAWLNIRAAIEREKSAIATEHTRSERFWRQPYVLAAAVVLAAVLSSGGTALYMNSRDRDEGSARATATNQGSESTPASLAAFTIEENTYLRNVAVLQDVLDQQEASLAPETVAQLTAALSAPAAAERLLAALRAAPATFDQSIVPCHFETSIPRRVVAACAVVGDTMSMLATTASRHDVRAMRAAISPPGYARIRP